MQIEYFELPSHWAAAFMNGDDTGLNDTDEDAMSDFVSWMLNEYGKCWCIDVPVDNGFSHYHDASRFGVKACDVSTFAFDVSKT